MINLIRRIIFNIRLGFFYRERRREMINEYRERSIRQEIETRRKDFNAN